MRAFKTAWFSKAARKAPIANVALCEAIQQVMQGQADDLGGGVFKKRLNNNQHRSIVLAKGRQFWIYTYLFAKQDKATVDTDELIGGQLSIKVDVRSSEQYGDQNEVKGFKAIAGSTPPAPVVKAPAAAGKAAPPWQKK